MKPRLRGQASEIRFADDAILCFQYREDAEKVKSVLSKRFAKYGLTLHPEKTRLVEFGRYAEVNAKRQGKKPCTLDFLGFTHICTRSRQGKFTVHVGDDAQAPPSGPQRSRPMVPGAPPRTSGGATENPQRQAPGPQPVLWPTDELSVYLEVLSGCPAYLAEVAQSPNSRTAAVVGEIRRTPAPTPLVATSDHACLDGTVSPA